MDPSPAPRLLGLLQCCAAFGCVIGVAACMPGFDDTYSPNLLKNGNQGVVFIRATYGGIPCKSGNIALATERSPGHFELHSSPMLGGLNESGLNSRQIALPVGTYHVGYVQCLVDFQTLVVGETDGTMFIGNPRQSLASFTVSAGEVVNVGQINFFPTDYLAKAATISVADVDAATMGRLRSGVPKLSSMLVTRLMVPSSPGQSYKISWVH